MKLSKLYEEVSNETQFQIRDREDSTYITAYNGAKIYGDVVLNWVDVDGYRDFEGDLGEDDYYELFPDDRYAKIVQLRVGARHQGNGHAKELMHKTLSMIKERGYDRVYLNASPMGIAGGLNLNDLVGFYRKFGFQVIPKLDKWDENKEMYLEL